MLQRLDRYLVYFQHYLMGKEFIPLEVEFMVSDTIELVRPRLKRVKTFQAAHQALIKVYSRRMRFSRKRLGKE